MKTNLSARQKKKLLRMFKRRPILDTLKRLVSRVRCFGCGKWGWMERRRLNTAYVDKKKNWMVSCQKCYDDTCEYYAEQWDIFYHG